MATTLTHPETAARGRTVPWISSFKTRRLVTINSSSTTGTMIVSPFFRTGGVSFTAPVT